MYKNNKRKSGFTLIELIAVLVILGILAGYAIPKYGDMKANAELAALDGVGAAAQSQCSIEYGALAMAGTTPTCALIATAAASNLTYDTKYTVAISDADPAVSIVVGYTDAAVTATKTYTWTMP